MRRFRRFLLTAVTGAIAITPSTAHAHGIQGRADLPVPIIAFYWAASIVLVVSFVGLAFAWKRPLLERVLARHRAGVPAAAGRATTAVLRAGRVLSVALLALVIATALFGSRDLNTNFAPIWVFVAWWIGIAVLAATVGDVWRAVHPAAAIARVMRMPEERAYPERFGMWPAFAMLGLFTWLELVYPTAANVRLLGTLVCVWLVSTLVSMRVWGIRPTLDNVEPFSAYTRVLGTLGVFGADGTGVERRPPIVGVIGLRPTAGLAAFVGLLIGSVSYDGLSRTLWWKQRVSQGTTRLVERGLEARDAQLVFGTIGLVVMVALAIGAFLATALVAGRLGNLPRSSRYGTVAEAFAPSLVPIAFAYVVAHYFSFFWFQAQNVVRLVSDPFGVGADIFGTADFQVDYSTLSANAIWGVQVGAIVVGHVVALVLAHDRALELEREGRAAHAVRSQWPMLALMVLYTVGGLYFLSEGLNG